ncbi:MAG: tol-pal system-associated acyl-CoA thioesterase [Beijerinckiaceae bacterium]
MQPDRLDIRIYYEDTDFSGVVYHASYLRFMERGRTEFLRAQGQDQGAMHEDLNGLAFAVRRMTIDFIKPARMDDIITVITHPADIKGASMTLDQSVMRGSDILVTAHVQVACVRNGRATRIPDRLRKILGADII